MSTPERLLNLGTLEDIAGFNLRRAHGAVQRHFSAHCADLALSQKQISVLWLVGDHPEIAQTDLARLLDMDRATTMAIVHALEKRALLARTKRGRDARKVALALTEAGVTILAQARVAIAEHEAWLTARFSPSELTELLELLRRIYC